MKRSFFSKLIFSIFLIASPAAGAAPDLLFATDFSQACRILKAEKPVSGNFTQKRFIAASNKTLKATGIFTASSEKILWETQKPFKNTLTITAQSITQTDSKGNSLILEGEENQTFALISKMMATLFSGNQKELEEYFETAFTGKENDSWIMELKPKDSTISSVMKLIELCGNAHFMTSMKTVQKNGDYLLYEFENQIEN